MIPKDYITAWRAQAPWRLDAQVEQDLVIVRAEPIGETLDRARAALDPWLGEPRRVFREERVNLVYRFESEDSPPLKLKLEVEINTREHFTELGVQRVPFLRPGFFWDFDAAMDAVLASLVARLPGEPWKGEDG